MLEGVPTLAPQPLTWLSCSAPQREEVGPKLSSQFLSIPNFSQAEVETLGAFTENSTINKKVQKMTSTLYIQETNEKEKEM